MSLITEQVRRTDRRTVEVKFYVTEGEAGALEEMATYLYKEAAIPKPSINAYAKAAAFKMYKELSDRLMLNQGNAKQ